MNDVVDLELLAVLTALLLLFLGAVVATRRAPNDYAGDDIRGWDELSRELDRSRRFGRTFALLRIQRPAGAGDDAVRAQVGQLGQVLRSIDHAWMGESAVYVLLPETNREAAALVGGRLERGANQLMPHTLSIVSFPDDGITAGALLAALDDARPREERQALPDIVSALAGSDTLAVQAADAPSVDLTDDRGR